MDEKPQSTSIFFWLKREQQPTSQKLSGGSLEGAASESFCIYNIYKNLPHSHLGTYQ